MTPAQLQMRIKKGAPPPAVLLLGPEAYERRRLKDALLASVPEGSVTYHDLAEMTLAEILDDARALSLFASERLIWVVNGEAGAAARPRRGRGCGRGIRGLFRCRPPGRLPEGPDARSDAGIRGDTLRLRGRR